MFGLVEVADQIWSSAAQLYLRPLPTRLGVSARGYSCRLQRVLTDFGVEQSFNKAAAAVQEHYGFAMGSSAVRTATLACAQKARARLEQEYEQPYRALAARGVDHLIAQVDGTMICTVQPGKRGGKRPRDWKEMRLAAAQAHGCQTTVYAATFGSVEQIGRRWGHCARQVGWGLQSRIHAVGDGADWIRRQSQEVFGLQGTFLCDFYHVSGYLAAAAATCQALSPGRWRHIQQKRLRRGAITAVLESLQAYLEPATTPDEESPVRNAHRYLSNRLACLDYPAALLLGLPIGSGMIESGHRHVLHSRLKNAGTAWLQDNADSIAHLRVLRANGNWSVLWN